MEALFSAALANSAFFARKVLTIASTRSLTGGRGREKGRLQNGQQAFLR